MTIDDGALLAAWRDGDRRAGAALFDRYFMAVMRFFRNKVDEGRLDDLIQQTMLGLLEARDSYRGTGSLRSFVFGIAFNVLRNHYRAAIRDEGKLDFGVTSIGDLAPGPAEVLAQHHEQRLLLQALRRIPIDHQVLLELYFWESLPAAEIAEVLAVPEGTVRTRIRRAKALLEVELRACSADPRLVEATLSGLETWARSLRGAASG